MGDKKYCICCGEEVPYYIVERDQKREYACSYCGFILEVLKLWEEGPKKEDNEINKRAEVKVEEVRAEIKVEGGTDPEKNKTIRAEEKSW